MAERDRGIGEDAGNGNSRDADSEKSKLRLGFDMDKVSRNKLKSAADLGDLGVIASAIIAALDVVCDAIQDINDKEKTAERLAFSRDMMEIAIGHMREMIYERRDG